MTQFTRPESRANQVADGFVQEKKFVNGHSASVSTLIALDAAGTFPCPNLLGRQADSGGHFLAGVRRYSKVFLDTMTTNARCESLGDTANQRGCNQVRLDAHFKETGNSADAVVRMERRKNQVSRLSSPNRDFGGFEIPDFSNQHHVRVVPQHGSQPCGERKSNLVTNLDLN